MNPGRQIGKALGVFLFALASNLLAFGQGQFPPDGSVIYNSLLSAFITFGGAYGLNKAITGKKEKI